MSVSEERADRIFKALGALEAGLIAIERAKTDRADFGAVVSKYEALEKEKADRIELIHLRDAIMKDLHETINDLSERIGDRFNATNSQILGLVDRLGRLGDRLDSMAKKDDARGAEIARLGDVIEDLARHIRQQAEALEAERANRWKKWRVRIHLTLQYCFQAFAGLTIIAIFLQKGVTGLPDAFDLLKAAFGAP